jgi:EmrB/QacA subfamily drug resistance transporter
VTDATTPAAPASSPAAELSPARRIAILAVVMAGTFMAIMDGFIVNVAVPSIRADLHAGFAQVQLIVSGYVLAYGLLLVTCGRLGDMHGYRLMFGLGIAVFTLASLACGLAPDPVALIAFRVVQALGAAMFYPQVLSVLQTMFSGQEQARAFSVFGATIGLAAICGQLLGGLLISGDLAGLHWRPIFLVNVPIGALALLGAALTMPSARAPVRPRLDLGGVVLLALALLLLSLPLVEGRELGWPAWTFVALALAVPVFAGFLAWERAVLGGGGNPLISFSLYARRAFSSGMGVAFLFFACNAGLFFVLAIELQIGLGYSPLVAGLLFTPLAVTFAITSLIVPRLQQRWFRQVLLGGYAINALGYLVLVLTAFATGSHVSGPVLIPALCIIGVGQGLGVGPLLTAILGNVPPADAGVASGLLETTGNVGMSLGVTTLGLVFFAIAGAGTAGAVYSRGFSTTLVVNLALALIALLLVPLLFPRPAASAG